MGLWSKGLERAQTGEKRIEDKQDWWMTPYVNEVRDFISEYLEDRYPNQYNTCDFKFHVYDAGSLSGRPNRIANTIWNICGEEVVMNHTIIYQQDPYKGLMRQLSDSIKTMPNPSNRLFKLQHKVESNINTCTTYTNTHYCGENKEILFQI